MKKLLLTLFIIASLILPMQGNADITKFGGFLPCTSDNGTICTTSRYISTPGITLSTSATFSFLTSGYLPKAGTGGALGNSAVYQDSSANIGLGTATFGTSAAKVIGIPSGTAPTTSPADAAQAWTADHNAQGGYARLHERTEDGKSAPIALLSEVESYKNPLAFAQGIYLTSSSTVGGIVVADSAVYENTTNSFGHEFGVSLPDYTPSANVVIGQDTDGTNGWVLYVLTTGYLRLTINDTNFDSTATLASVGITDGYPVAIGFSVTRSATLDSVLFAVNGYQLGNAVTSANEAGITVANASDMYTMGTSTTRSAGRIYYSIPYNRAKTAAEHLAFFKLGVDYADKWGSQTAKYTSDFSVGEDSFTAYTGNTLTGNTDSINGSDNWLKVEHTGAAGYMDWYRTVSGLDDKNIRVTATVYNPPGSTLEYIKLSSGTGGTSSVAAIPANAETNVTLTGRYGATVGGVQRLYFTICNSQGTSLSNVATGQILYIKNIITYETGATLALEPEGIQRDAWKDSSTNGLNAAYPASGSSLTRQFPLGMETLLSTTTVTFAADGDTNLFTVPTGRRCVLTKAIIIAADNANSTDITIGQDGAESDWLPTNQMDNLDAANDAIIVMPVPNTTPTKIKSYAGGTVIQINVANHAGAAGNTVMLFGVLY